MKKHISGQIIALILILIIAIGIYWTLYLQKAHSTFENYATFRGCKEILEQTSEFATCKINSGEIIKIVKYQGKWFLDGDLPNGFLSW